MKRIRKRVVSILMGVAVMLTSTLAVFAASGNYSSTYDMTGGIYVKKTWTTSATPTFKVSNSNCYSECPVSTTIDVMLKKSTLTGWSTVKSGSLNAGKSSSCSLKGSGKGKYQIYLRTASGYRMTGNIKVSWSW